MNNLLLFSICYISYICNSLLICPFSFGFCPRCLSFHVYCSPSFERWTVTLKSNTIIRSHTLSLHNLSADPPFFVEKRGMFSFTCASLPPSYVTKVSFFFLHLGWALERWKHGGGGAQETVDGEMEENGKRDPSLHVSPSVTRTSVGCPWIKADHGLPANEYQFYMELKTTVAAIWCADKTV